MCVYYNLDATYQPKCIHAHNALHIIDSSPISLLMVADPKLAS